MTRGRATILAASLLAVAGNGVAHAQDVAPYPQRQAVVVYVPGVSFERLMAIPEIRRLARAGGSGLMSSKVPVNELMRAAIPGAKATVLPCDCERLPLGTFVRAPGTVSLPELGRQIRALVDNLSARQALVVVVGSQPSRSMVERKDELFPIVLARGDPRGLRAPEGSGGALTSDSTRRDGVVVGADVVTMVAGFIDRTAPASAVGFPIRVVDAPPPFELHERYLAMRRMWVPVQTAAALYVTFGGLFALAVLAAGRRARPVLGVIASGIAISVGPLAAALLAAGHLPTLSYATVVPFVVVATVALVALVLLGATRELLHPMLPLGIAILVFLLVESLLGWTAALTPFLGGSELDGGRFYGLPNVFIGLLLGASLYAASRLPASGGFALLVAAALLAGLPFAGANLGGAVTILAAAGAWLPLRRGGRLGWRGLAFAGAVVVVGTGIVLLAHRLSPLPTHVTRFEETRGAGGAWSAFVDRLGVGWRLIEHNPFAIVPVVGVVATLGVLLRPPRAFAASLAHHPAWRDALLVLAATSALAYVVNDSGSAACGVGFGMALGGLVYVSAAERTWKMDPA